MRITALPTGSLPTREVGRSVTRVEVPVARVLQSKGNGVIWGVY